MQFRTIQKSRKTKGYYLWSTFLGRKRGRNKIFLGRNPKIFFKKQGLLDLALVIDSFNSFPRIYSSNTGFHKLVLLVGDSGIAYSYMQLRTYFFRPKFLNSSPIDSLYKDNFSQISTAIRRNKITIFLHVVNKLALDLYILDLVLVINFFNLFPIN